MLGDGSVTLTTVGLLAAHLTPENHRDLLAMARHQGKRQVEDLVARLRPQPAVPASVRRLPTAGHTPASPTARERAATSPQPAGNAHGVSTPVVSGPRAASTASGRRRPAGARALQGAVHGERRDAREAHARAGGASTADNIQLRCRAHNGDEAERDFGRHTPSVVKDARAPHVHPTEQPPPPSRLAQCRHSVRTEYGPGPVRSPRLSGRAAQQHAGSDG